MDRFFAVPVFLVCLLLASPLVTERWWKGNLHTHTLWSDGDDYPEMVLDWYKSRGYVEILWDQALTPTYDLRGDEL